MFLTPTLPPLFWGKHLETDVYLIIVANRIERSADRSSELFNFCLSAMKLAPPLSGPLMKLPPPPPQLYDIFLKLSPFFWSTQSPPLPPTHTQHLRLCNRLFIFSWGITCISNDNKNSAFWVIYYQSFLLS